MKKKFLVTTVMVLMATNVWAQEQATSASQDKMRAQKMVYDAVNIHASLGVEAAADAINKNRDEKFVEGEQYVFALRVDDSVIIAHSSDPSQVDEPIDFVIGDPPAQIADKMKERGLDGGIDGAWIKYQWKNPVTGLLSPKKTFFVLYEGISYGSGIYP